MPKATTLDPGAPPGGRHEGGPGPAVDQILAGLQVVGRTIGQVRVHERLLKAAGVRLDRAGSSLLYKLHAHGGPLRVSALADLLGVDAPTVTRKVQQLEREGLVERQPDPDDGRAVRIGLAAAGRTTIERVLKARRVWVEGLVESWSAEDLHVFGALLTRFASSLEHDMEEARGC